MFTNKTVFVLGAGASWHYGYPTGEGLTDSVISMAARLSGYCEQRLRAGQIIQFLPEYVTQRIDDGPGGQGAGAAWQKVRDECQRLIERLSAVRPLVIDYFLAWNESLRPIGKLMIAAAILECEAVWLRERGNQNRRLVLANAPTRPTRDDLQKVDITKYKDDWYRFVVHKLVYGCGKSADLCRNDVHFITFNYDASLEYHLFRALTSIDLLRAADVESFLRDHRIVHIYGSVHPSIPKDADAIDLEIAQKLGNSFAGPLNYEVEFGSRKVFLDRCLTAAENLRTIDPDDKENDQASLELARAWIDESTVVYILGYGFDPNNNRRIGLDPSFRWGKETDRSVMFTNFGDINTINKKASKLFFGSHERFFEFSIHGDPKKGNYVEKSVRTVYDALEMDFDALESELIAGTKI
jgi:hypothetical protein